MARYSLPECNRVEVVEVVEVVLACALTVQGDTCLPILGRYLLRNIFA
jgi:hypothetical protein